MYVSKKLHFCKTESLTSRLIYSIRFVPSYIVLGSQGLGGEGAIKLGSAIDINLPCEIIHPLVFHNPHDAKVNMMIK